MQSPGTIYDLERRTHSFYKRILIILKSLPRDETNRDLKIDCLKSSKAIGLIYKESTSESNQDNPLPKLEESRTKSIETTELINEIINHNPSFGKKMLSLRKESLELTKALSKNIKLKKKTEKKKINKPPFKL